MIKRTIFAVLFLGIIWGKTALTIDNVDISEDTFFSKIPKTEWEASDSTQKSRMLNDYIRRATANLEAKALNLQHDPKNKIKLNNHKYRTLVNQAYEEFVARKLISDKLMTFTREYLKEEVLVHHILIGYHGCYLKQEITRSKDGALTLAQKIITEYNSGGSFQSLATTYSDDPSASRNFGKLDWLPVGKTVESFQEAAFTTGVNNISEPVLTEYGYHIIFIEDSRPSQAAELDSLRYENEVFNAALNLVYNKLKDAADLYDQNIIIDHDVVFNNNNIIKILDGIEIEKNKSKIVGSSNIDLVATLNNLNNIGVVCVFNGKSYGAKWFANRIARIPSRQRYPNLSTIENIQTAFQKIILQEIAIEKALEYKLTESVSYIKEYQKYEEQVLYDSYVKYIINNIDEPSDEAIAQYYNENKDESFKEGEKVSIREIKVREQEAIDSIYVALNTGDDFISIAEQRSLTGKGGKIEPFVKGRYSKIGKAAFDLLKGDYSEPIENLDGTWSIILLEDILPEKYSSLNKVRNRIESILKRDLQAKSKVDSFNALKEKFNIVVNPEFY